LKHQNYDSNLGPFIEYVQTRDHGLIRLLKCRRGQLFVKVGNKFSLSA
jgi:hypothetical protein